MSVDIRFYIIGRPWWKEEFSPVVSFTSNLLRSPIRNGDISCSDSCGNGKAEILIKEKIRSEYNVTEEGCDTSYKCYYEDNLHYLTLENIKVYMDLVDKWIDERKKLILEYTADKLNCKSVEVYERICEKIDEQKRDVQMFEEEKEDLKFAYDGLRFYLYHILDIDDSPGSYVIGYIMH